MRKKSRDEGTHTGASTGLSHLLAHSSATSASSSSVDFSLPNSPKNSLPVLCSAMPSPIKCAAQSMYSKSTGRFTQRFPSAVCSEFSNGVTGGVGMDSSSEGGREMMRYERRSFESVRGPLRNPSINSKQRRGKRIIQVRPTGVLDRGMAELLGQLRVRLK